jgi:Family of unknown function (DUF6593)
VAACALTQEILYYCETDDNQKITIHKGNREGEVIADASQCLEKEGVTDIHLHQPSHAVICLEHSDSLLPFFSGQNSFTYGDRKYHWKGHTALIDDESGVLLGALHTRFLEKNPRSLGTLIVTPDGRGMMDVVVTTCLVMQERSEEGRLAVYSSDCMY